MNLRGIVAVSGKPGLYKVIGQNKAGFVLESLDEAKNKTVINGNAKVAALQEITVYGQNDDLHLRDIIAKMGENLAGVPEPKADGKVLKDYFAAVAPEHDSERVYVSDIKKIVSWVKILSTFPLWNEADSEVEQTQPVEEVEEKAVEEAPAPKKTRKTKKAE
ncbi:DUF5606 domain-containing protein [Solitalea sp. MAHUQ-68]|uniref:DUF5606 domain-containing protein n=1 Tax=Solitalea agri TaxID=2953739 RepID=A0A9X2F008_9SPHI|nr:DUF5606 domain-containing protein [Solitalea agri]MCO4292092.1 DUF5606 domain-containing protein [Solitalea agri]